MQTGLGNSIRPQKQSLLFNHLRIILWVLASSPSAGAQDLSGYWQGFEYDPARLANFYPTSLTIVQQGSVFTGNYYESVYRMNQYNALFAIEKGQFNNYSGSFEISTPVRDSIYSGGYWCTGLFTFTYNPDREQILATTTYRESECKNSTVELYRAKIKSKPIYCPAEVKELTAYGFDVRWYADAQRQLLLYHGRAYQPTIDTTTTFYITQSLFAEETPPIPVTIHVDKIAISSSASVSALCTTGKGQITVNATGIKPFQYRLNAGSYQASPDFDLDKPGSYSIAIEDSLGCKLTQLTEIADNCETSLYLPKAFSPNGDGINDEFTLLFAYRWLTLNEFTVFDRWGSVLYQNTSSIVLKSGQSLWLGNTPDKPLIPGLYTYQLRATTPDGKSLLLRDNLTVL